MIRIASLGLVSLFAAAALGALPGPAQAYVGPPHCGIATSPKAASGVTWHRCSHGGPSWLQSNEPPRLTRDGVCRYVRRYRPADGLLHGLAIANGAACPPTIDSPGVVQVFPNLAEQRFLEIMSLSRARLRHPVKSIERTRGGWFSKDEEYRIRSADPRDPSQGESLMIRFLSGKVQPIGPAGRWIA